MGDKGVLPLTGILPSPSSPRAARPSNLTPRGSSGNLRSGARASVTVQEVGSGGSLSSPLSLPEVSNNQGGRRFARRGGVPVLHNDDKHRDTGKIAQAGFNELMEVLKEIISTDTDDDSSLDAKFGAIGEHLYKFTTMKKHRKTIEEIAHQTTDSAPCSIQGSCKLLDTVFTLTCVTYPSIRQAVESAWCIIKGFVFSNSGGGVEYDTATLHSEESFRKQLKLNKAPGTTKAIVRKWSGDVKKLHFRAWRSVVSQHRTTKAANAKKLKWEKEVASDKNLTLNRLEVMNSKLVCQEKRIEEEASLHDRELKKQKQIIEDLEAQVAALSNSVSEYEGKLINTKQEVATIDEYYDTQINDLTAAQNTLHDLISDCLLMQYQEHRHHELSLRDELMGFIRPFLDFGWEESLQTLPRIAGRWLNICSVNLRDRVPLVDPGTVFMKEGNEDAEIVSMYAMLHHVAPLIIPNSEFKEFLVMVSLQTRAEAVVNCANRMGLTSGNTTAAKLVATPSARLHMVVDVMLRLINCWGYWVRGAPVYTALPDTPRTPTLPVEDRRKSAAACPPRLNDKVLTGVAQKQRAHTVTILLPGDERNVLPQKRPMEEKPTTPEGWKAAVAVFMDVRAELDTASSTLMKTLLMWTLRRHTAETPALAYSRDELDDMAAWRLKEVDVATLLAIPLEDSVDTTDSLNDVVTESYRGLRQVYHYYYVEGEGRVDVRGFVRDLKLKIKDPAECMTVESFLRFCLSLSLTGDVEGDPRELFELFVRNVVDVLCWRCDVGSVKHIMQSPSIAALLNEYRHGLEKVYQTNSDGRNLTFSSFKKLFTDTLKVVDARLTHHILSTIYYKALPVGVNSSIPSERVRVGYEGFCFLLCVVATVKYPNPFIPNEVRVRKFIEQILVPAFPSVRRNSRCAM
eukprot:TRINITY_DN2803_c2_g1_i6.p1 TRINITY_DN2803_c2_g1~~TRINITY_DN2803_c2_g1_i6.p1  ORF type:complete len:948 (+),score=205.48 TRINITY_DN2803_c2_g1_i6:117-2846(+)